MARPFSSKDVKALEQAHEQLRASLLFVTSSEKDLIAAIKAATHHYVEQEVHRLLKDIPIEEINRDAHGVRVKALRCHGYRTVDDVYGLSTSKLASIHGVGESSARATMETVDVLASRARRGIRIHLSTDDKTPGSTEIVSTISRYLHSQEHISTCKNLIDRYDRQINVATSALEAGTSSLKWFFSSSTTKKRTTEAYNELRRLLDYEYGTEARSALLLFNTSSGRSSAQAWDDFSQNPIPFFNTLEKVTPALIGSTDSVYGLPKALAAEIKDEALYPDGLLCTLRRYQEWGVKYALHQGRVLLGDEMGLGKTIQAIATMVSLRNTGATHFMVVCPASVLTNWCREIKRMSLLNVVQVHGSERDEAFDLWCRSGGVAVTTYGTIGTLAINKLTNLSLLTVDEAHYIKNPEAQRTKNIASLCEHADRLLFMTGTALENNVDEMVNLIQMLQPRIAESVRSLSSMPSAPVFRDRIAPVYYRRKRDDVLTELPELTESKEWCIPLPQERENYERAVLSRRYSDARRVSWNIDDLNNSSKARRLMEIVEEAESDGRKVLVFSFFLDTLEKLQAFLGDRCIGQINGSVTPNRRQELVDEFDRSRAGTVLIAQIQSGGTGLNIQSASIVILCEPQFKPSIENQAISRAYRMGQTRKVLVYRLLCPDTVDEKVTSLLANKQAIFDAFADKSVAASKSLELDATTFGNIIEEEIERINREHGTAGVPLE